ncbi:MAG: T9SS type A sorting domain-containing protein [Saprospiraceae bacterium]|nr:T9SS type A sorting domain-containing protein [Saprospiraceae bacterium]
MSARSIFIIILILMHYFLIAQNNDYVWPMGSAGGSSIELLEMDSLKEWTPFSLNFSSDPMKIDYFLKRRFTFDASNSNYSTDEGNLFCYTNGMQLYGPDDQPIQGGDTINYNNYWRSKVHWQTGERLGFTQFQGNLILPIKQLGENLLYVFNIVLDRNVDGPIGVWYSVVNTDCNNGKGCVISKDKILMQERIKSNHLKACRHANGRDWWLIIVGEDMTIFYTYLLDSIGIHKINVQNIGKFNPRLSAGNATFSHRGDQYAVNDGRYWDSIGVISIFDFDRCSGLLSNPFFDTLVIPEASIGQGIAFSPDDRYLYVNNMNDLYQYDMKDLNKPRIHLATYDGFQDPTDWPGIFTTQFGFWGYGPDGRLYNVSGSASSRYMHVMDYPNEEGIACSFRQHAIRVSNNPRIIPNFPHYRLGPLDGSPCDTLGLDNHPIAKYRYEVDSIDYLRLRFTDLSYFRPEKWSWDLGDGSPLVSTQSPYHTFPKSGTYNVCLTVSNENSSNTSCRTITLGTSSSDDMAVTPADVSLFPNPVQDYLLITLGEYVPAHGQVMIYDVTGRPVITQRIYYGQNSVDMSGLQAGVYVWKVMDVFNPSPVLPSRRKGEAVVVREGKVVKL